jgi:hypothetical protein
MKDDRYSGISFEAIRRSRAVLSRESEESGVPTRINRAGLRATGATRTELLRQVREAAESQRLAVDGRIRFVFGRLLSR